MSDTKNIERLYQEAFNNFEAKPSTAVWSTIKTDLKKQQKRRFIPLWIMCTTASLLLGTVLFFNLNKTSQVQEKIINSTQHEAIVFNNASIRINSIPKNLSFYSTSNKNIYKTKKSSFLFQLDNDLLRGLSFKNNFSDYNFSINPASEVTEIKTNTFSKKNNTIAKKELEPINTTTAKWDFTPFINTNYFSSLSQGSPLDESLKNNKKVFEVSKSYGLSIGRRINNKWRLFSGLALLKLNYSTLNIAYKNEFNINSRLSGVLYNRYNNYTSVRDFDNTILAINEHVGSIHQEIAYVEVPLAVSYTFKNTKHVDLSLTGGISSLFLAKNKLTLIGLDGDERYFGKANNLSTINAAANASFDFNYHFSKTLHLNVSPSFKYYLEMFDQNSGNFKPYSVGVTTGVKINF